MTTRPLDQRIQEIQAFLAQYFPTVKITPLFHLNQVPYVEGYFKARFAQYQLPIGQATEYFTLQPDLAQIQAEFKALDQAVQTGFSVSMVQVDAPLEQDEKRPRFRATFERYANRPNPFTGWYEDFLLLVDLSNLATKEHIADWQWFSLGKTFEALGQLNQGNVLEFNAALENSQLKRPTKIVRKKG